MASTTYYGLIDYKSVKPTWHTIYEGSDTDTTGVNYRDSRIYYPSGTSNYLCTPYIPSSPEINVKLRFTIKYQTNWLPEYQATMIGYYNRNLVYATNRDVNTVVLTLDNMQYFDSVSLVSIQGFIAQATTTDLIELKWPLSNFNIYIESGYNSTAVANNIYCLAWITKIEQYY